MSVENNTKPKAPPFNEKEEYERIIKVQFEIIKHLDETIEFWKDIVKKGNYVVDKEFEGLVNEAE